MVVFTVPYTNKFDLLWNKFKSAFGTVKFATTYSKDACNINFGVEKNW